MRRPPLVTLLALAIFALALFNLQGVISGVQRYTVLRALPLSVAPAYLLLSRALWALVFALCGWGLWRLRGWVQRGLPLALALYLAQGWFDRLVLARSDFARTSLPYHLVLQVLAWAVVAALVWARPNRRAFSTKR
jgi:hypothetical protein